MTVVRPTETSSVATDKRDPVSGHRPSVDVLMLSVAREYGSKEIGAIMTGMLNDGAEGITDLHRGDGTAIAQDKESPVIFGMNRAMILAGDADIVAAVGRIAAHDDPRGGVPAALQTLCLRPPTLVVRELLHSYLR